MDEGGPKHEQVQSYSSSDANGRAHWRHLANTIELSVRGGDAALCQVTLTTCWDVKAERIKDKW